MSRSGTHRLLAPATVLGLLGVQLLALYLPQSPGPPSPVPHSDKLVHAGVFGAPVLVAGLALRRWWLPVTLVCAVHAPVSEVIQHVGLDGRAGDVRDVVADLVGIGVALAGVGWALRRPRRRRLQKLARRFRPAMDVARD